MINILGVTFKEFIQKGNVIVGIALAIVGVACWLLAPYITKAVRKTGNVKSNDTLLIGLKVAALVSLLIGMILIAIPV
ncbi:MAG: hypothetical protein IJA72_03910 [Clostridia bacterium]|nr:hypothetical protein [Clostridia bacterium]